MKPGLLMLPSAVSDSRVHNILPNKIETDFQFSRASAATRVNHQGLIEEVGYFSDELVQNGNFSELGSELVTNGDFATDSDWSKSVTSPNIVQFQTGQVYLKRTVSAANEIFQSVFVVGKTYKVIIQANIISEGIAIEGNGNLSRTNLTSGANVFYLTPTSVVLRIICVNNTTEGYISNVSVKQVDPNDYWVLGTGSTKTDTLNIISTDGSLSYGKQQGVLEVGKTYQYSFDITSYTSGNLFFIEGSTTVLSGLNATGTYRGVFTATGTDIEFKRGGVTNASFDNISVVEVQGDKPRLDYDPTNPTCPHLLLEPQSTNLIPFSEDFSQWNTFNITAETNTAINPKGTSGCYRIFVDNTTNSNLFLSTASIGTSYTISIYAKSNNANKDNFQLRIGDSRSSVFTATSEWQRFTYSATATGSNTFAVAIFSSSGTVSSDILIFGAQVETTAYATSYIPTAGAAETRVAETCTNAGNVDTFNDAEGVLYAELLHRENDTNSNQISISDGTNNNNVKLVLSNSSDNLRGVVKVGGVNQCELDTDITRDNFHKIAILYKSNDFKLYVNGSLVVTDTIGSVPTGLDTVSFDRGDANNDFYGKVKGLATYNRALTDNELYTITSTQYSAYSGMVAALGNYTIPC